MSRLFIVLVIFLGVGLPLLAQDTPTPIPPDTGVEPGTLITGTIDDATPRQVFYFEGSRGEVIRFQLQTTDGNLDPVMTVFDDTGMILFNRDDRDGNRDVAVMMTIPASTRFYVVVGRFGYSQGSTRGEFELVLERVGVISEQGTNLLYNIPVIDTISSTQPQIYYTFRAEAGDIVNIEMVRSSGTLDPFLQIVDSNRFVLAENDDAPTNGTRNARIENLIIENTGTYIIVATRYGQAAGESVGSFVLTITESEKSGLANSELTAFPISYNQTHEDVINADQFTRYYVFAAQRDDLITITQNQTTGQLDAFLTLANAGLQPLITDDDSGGGRNARIERYRIPADGEYYIIAGRIDGETGTSTGDYRLQLVYEGSAFEGVNDGIPRLEFGSTTQDTITLEDDDSIFAFYGQKDEQVTIAVYRATGDLDPVVQLLDNNQTLLASDDDSAGGQNARIQNYRLPATGVYYIRATRYQGNEGTPNTTGGYNLILSRGLE